MTAGWTALAIMEISETAGVVCDTLAEASFEVEENVGQSGCKIDLAVRHPEHKDCFCIGIVCDGDSYHAATTARDRGRLRSQVLTAMGWDLYHVWACEWQTDSERQRELLLDAVKQAVDSFVPPVERAIVEVPRDETRSEETAAAEQLSLTIDDADAQIDDAPIGNEGPVEKAAESSNLSFEVVEDEHPYGFQDFPEYRPPRNGRATELDIVRQLIIAQAPFSLEYFLQKFREYCHPKNPKMTTAIRASGMGYLQAKLKDQVVLRKEYGVDYVFRRDQRVLLPRVVGLRDISVISTSELREGVLAVLRGYLGELDRKGLIDETSRAFGFARRSRIIEERISEAIDDLRLYGKVKVVDGYYVSTGR